MKQTCNQIREDLARLQGARYVTAVEIDKGRQLSEVIVKQVTGDDIITARYLRKNSFEFRPKFKVFWAANDKPEIWGNDYAIWSRLHLIQFKHRFDRNDTENTIKSYSKQLLSQEASGILNWAIAGCLDWQKQGGLCPPRSIRDNTAMYRSEQDVIGRFLREKVEFKQDMRVLKGELYDAYKNWCHETGEYPISKKLFGSRIKDKKIKTKKSGQWYWLDIRLKSLDYTEEYTEIL